MLWRILEWPIALVWWTYAKVVSMTSRVIVEGAVPNTPSIFVNWHRHQAFLIPHHGRYGRTMLVSPAAAVAPIARFCLLCGLRLVRGTSGDRGKQAIETMTDLVANGHSVTLAVDGPAGPPFEVKRGCADLSLRTGVPIVPVTYECRRGLTLNWRWDRMLLPVPFDRITIRYGAPIAPEGDTPSMLTAISAVLGPFGRS